MFQSGGKSGQEAILASLNALRPGSQKSPPFLFCLEELEVSVLEKPHAAAVAGPVEVDLVLVPPLSFPAG